jgi:hypothetical protein
MSERFVSQPVDEAIGRSVQKAFRDYLGIKLASPPMELFFPTLAGLDIQAPSKIDIANPMPGKAIPNGFLTLFQTGPIWASYYPYAWTADRLYMSALRSQTRAVVVFLLREETERA